MTKVCIGIPTYKTDIKKFEETIKSVIDQNFFDLHVIVSENYPPNQDLEKFIKNLKTNFKIEHIKQNNFLSQTENWDFIVKKCSSEYLMFLGDDDQLSKNFINSGLKILESREDIYGVCTRIVHTYPNKAQVISIAGGTSSIRVKELANLKINAGGKIEVYGKPKQVISRYTLGGKVLLK